jgi:hypothetical protein
MVCNKRRRLRELLALVQVSRKLNKQQSTVVEAQVAIPGTRRQPL